MVAYWKVYHIQNRTTNDRSTEKSMSFHLVCISLYKKCNWGGLTATVTFVLSDD